MNQSGLDLKKSIAGAQKRLEIITMGPTGIQVEPKHCLMGV